MEFLEDLEVEKNKNIWKCSTVMCLCCLRNHDFYAEKGVYLWDFAAGICLVQEAGGNVNYNSWMLRYSVKFSK